MNYNSSYYLIKEALDNVFSEAEDKLINSQSIKFKKCTIWRNTFIPPKPGVYILFDDNHKILYVGESGNLNARLNEINRTVNHSFRRELGCRMFKVLKSRRKYEPEIETLLDKFFEDKLYVSFLEVNFGRLEIETYLISKYESEIYNSKKKRK